MAAVGMTHCQLENYMKKIYNLSEPSENIKITFGAGAQFISKKKI